jgi:putative ABC transport system permease protein
MLSDLKFALRSLAKSPGFSLIAIATLALGIGANTAIFSVVQSALLRPLPFPRADRLVRVYESFDEKGERSGTLNLSEKSVRQWQQTSAGIFEGLGTATGAAVTVNEMAGEPARNIPAARISANFLDVLGLPPALGRNFDATEDRPGGPRVAIVSHEFWQRQFGGRADVLGQSVTLDGAPYTIVGVMPKAFRHPYRAEVWLPLAATFSPEAVRNHYLYGVARLRPGLTLHQADLAGRLMCSAVNQAEPDPLNPRRLVMLPLRESFVTQLRPKLLIIAAAALCALLVAAANFAGLMLARTVERDGEMALRAALGASRGRLVRQGLAQTFILALIGTISGLLIASWLTPALISISPEGADATGSAIREFDYGVRLDWPVFAFASGAMLLIGVGFGLLPAWRASRPDLKSNLGSTGRGTTVDPRTRRLLGGLIIVEIAVASVLLMSSLTLTQYFRKVVNEPWGFSTDGRLIFNVMYSDRLFASAEARGESIERTLRDVSGLPGVQSATVTVPSPTEAARDLIGCTPDGSHPPESSGTFLAYLRATRPGFFNTLRQPLLRGRDFTEADRGDSTVCIVNESLVRRFWPGENPLGKKIKQGRLDGPRPWSTIVGVVGDTKAIADPQDGDVIGTYYMPLARGLAAGDDEMTFVLKVEGKPEAMAGSVRSAVSRGDARLAAYELYSLDRAVADTWVTERFLSILVSLFGLLGLLLATIGVYGLLVLQVARRTREFGLRIALGSTAAALIQLVAAQAVRLLVVGFLIGGASAWAVVHVAQRRWPQVPAAAPVVWIGAAFVLAGAIAVASWWPARRASRVDPMVALRAE